MRYWLASALLVAAPTLVLAHTVSPYILPEQFDSKEDSLSLQSAMTVEKFFVPSNNFKTSYQLTDPAGKTSVVEAAASLTRFNVAEVNTPADGTYRLRTTNTPGSINKYALIDGNWIRVRPARAQAAQPAKADSKTGGEVAARPAGQPPRFVTEDQIPAKAKVLETVNIPIAETFITKGKPSPIPDISGQGFEVKLLTHPNELYANDALKAQVFMDGKPVPGLKFEVFKGLSSYERDAEGAKSSVTTNDKGEFELKFDQPGIYLITTAYPAAKPDRTKQPAAKTYSYGLSVEVTE
ncbi:DUF4198 domain-containing protein [Alkanindiges sp. WGS2144]|uniref:DUF4198 domain-containing protein n=1 Tax=Alkanindiges sp. WGS2144 TaxID=3366808 RepID=UPI0037512D45